MNEIEVRNNSLVLTQEGREFLNKVESALPQYHHRMSRHTITTHVLNDRDFPGDIDKYYAASQELGARFLQLTAYQQEAATHSLDIQELELRKKGWQKLRFFMPNLVRVKLKKIDSLIFAKGQRLMILAHEANELVREMKIFYQCRVEYYNKAAKAGQIQSFDDRSEANWTERIRQDPALARRLQEVAGIDVEKRFGVKVPERKPAEEVLEVVYNQLKRVVKEKV